MNDVWIQACETWTELESWLKDKQRLFICRVLNLRLLCWHGLKKCQTEHFLIMDMKTILRDKSRYDKTNGTLLVEKDKNVGLF